jgi:outer membrane biogenesis lipoprotein LolB
MVAGGTTFLPSACSAMLKKEEKDTAEKFEQQNAQVREIHAWRVRWFVGVGVGWWVRGCCLICWWVGVVG